MLEELNSENWKQAFGFAGESDTICSKCNFDSAIPNTDYNFESFSREDVYELYGIDEFENDLICYGLLKDGRYFYLNSYCDCDGWSHTSTGVVMIGETKEEIEIFCLTESAKTRMNLLI